MMNTSTETFSVEGTLKPFGVSSWELRANNLSIFGYFIPPKLGMDGQLIFQKGELLNLLGVISPQRYELEAGDDEMESFDVLRLPLLQAPNRQLETIYRAPEEELLLVKVAVTTF